MKVSRYPFFFYEFSGSSGIFNEILNFKQQSYACICGIAQRDVESYLILNFRNKCSTMTFARSWKTGTCILFHDLINIINETLQVESYINGKILQ